MGRRLLIAGRLNLDQKKAIGKAFSYNGPEPKTLYSDDCVIQHKVGGKTLLVPLEQSAYVGAALPNPVPYRGVSIGVADMGEPHISYTLESTGMYDQGGLWTMRNSAGIVTGTQPWSIAYIEGTIDQSGGSYSYQYSNAPYTRTVYVAGSPPGCKFYAVSGSISYRFNTREWVLSDGSIGWVYDGLGQWIADNSLSFVCLDPSYESILAADQAARTGGRSTLVFSSDGGTLARESQSTDSYGNVSFYPGSTAWSGGGYVAMFYQPSSGSPEFNHKLTFDVPEDCVYPIVETPPAHPGQATPAKTYTLSEKYRWSSPDFTLVDIEGGGGFNTFQSQVFLENVCSDGARVILADVIGSYYYEFRPVTDEKTGKTWFEFRQEFENYNYPDEATIPFPVNFGTGQASCSGQVYTGSRRGKFDALNGVPYDVEETLALTPLKYTVEYLNAQSAVRAANINAIKAENPAISDMQRWYDDWAVGAARGKTRRKLWFKKNSDTTLANLVSGVLPKQWDYLLKYLAPDSRHTKRPYPMTATMISESITDNTDDLAKAGVKTINRVWRLSYQKEVKQPEGTVTLEPQQQDIPGSLTQVVTQHKDNLGTDVQLSIKHTYKSWYDDSSPGAESCPPHQFVSDRTARGMGLFWDGEIQDGYHADSSFGSPMYSAEYPTWRPPYPAYSNTLVGTAPQFVLDYHSDNKPIYDSTIPDNADRTAWLSSSLMDGMTVTLIPFGPVIVTDGAKEGCGMFAHQNEIDQAVMIEIYGSATFRYHYADGSFNFVSWNPLKYAADDDETAATELGYRVLKDSSGNNAQLPDANGDMQDFRARFINIPIGVKWPSYNCVIRYGNLEWPDVIKTAKANAAERAEGKGDQFMREIIRAVNEPLKKA